MFRNAYIYNRNRKIRTRMTNARFKLVATLSIGKEMRSGMGAQSFTTWNFLTLCGECIFVIGFTFFFFMTDIFHNFKKHYSILILMSVKTNQDRTLNLIK